MHLGALQVDPSVPVSDGRLLQIFGAHFCPPCGHAVVVVTFVCHVSLPVVAKLVWRLIRHQFWLAAKRGTLLLQVEGHHGCLFQDLDRSILGSTLNTSSLLVQGNG